MSQSDSPKMILARDAMGLAKHAAQMVLEAASAAYRANGRFVFCLTGGTTPKKLYELLAEPYYKERMDWANTFVLFGDERCVPPTDDQSNYKMAHDALLGKVPVPQRNVLRMPGEMTPPADGAKAYEQALKALFKGYFPKIDLLLLGVGDDGHIASLFPNTDALKETDKWVVANHVAKLSANRLTLTLPVINNAQRILFLVSGESKAAVIKEILRNDTPHRYPAQRVETYEGEVTWLLDKPAMSKCPDELRHKAFHL